MCAAVRWDVKHLVAVVAVVYAVRLALCLLLQLASVWNELFLLLLMVYTGARPCELDP